MNCFQGLSNWSTSSPHVQYPFGDGLRQSTLQLLLTHMLGCNDYLDPGTSMFRDITTDFDFGKVRKEMPIDIQHLRAGCGACILPPRVPIGLRSDFRG